MFPLMLLVREIAWSALIVRHFHELDRWSGLCAAGEVWKPCTAEPACSLRV